MRSPWCVGDEEHLCYSKCLLVLLVQYKSTAYNRILKKKKKSKTLKCGSVTILEWEKPKLIPFLFPSVSSMRGIGKNHNNRSRVDAVLCFCMSQSFVLLQNTACMQKLSGSHSQASGHSVCTWTKEAPQQLRVGV